MESVGTGVEPLLRSPPPRLCMGGGSVGTTDRGKGSVRREVRKSQTGRVKALGAERPMGTAGSGGNAFKERTRGSGERPVGAARCRQSSIQASVNPPPPPRPHTQRQFSTSPMLSRPQHKCPRRTGWRCWDAAARGFVTRVALRNTTGTGHTLRRQWTQMYKLVRAGAGFGTRPRYSVVCLWRRLLASRHFSF